MKPKWQRARVLTCAAMPIAVGEELWIKIEKPFLAPAVDVYAGVEYDETPSFETSLRFDGRRICIHAEQIELLARDTNDFADDVPAIEWKDYLAALQARHPTV